MTHFLGFGPSADRPMGKRTETLRLARRLTVESLEERCLLSTLQAISLPPANQPPSDTAAGISRKPSVSSDGRYVVFESTASNLVPGQTGGTADNIFLLDRGTATMTLVSHVPVNATAASSSDVGLSYSPVMSANGRYVVYTSQAPEIVGGSVPQAVVYDRTTGQNTLASHSVTSLTMSSDDNSVAIGISSDGRYVVFESYSSDLVPNQVTTPPGPGTGKLLQLFVYDQTTQTTAIVTHAFGQANVTANGPIYDTESYLNASVADDGTIAYVSLATNLVGFTTTKPQNVYLYSSSSQTNQLISAMSGAPTTDAGSSATAFISRDGSAVTYVSDAPDLVPGQTGNAGEANVFRYDRLTGTTTLVSGRNGSATTTTSNFASPYGLAISGNGLLIAFISDAPDLIPGQSGTSGNVFLYDASGPSLSLVSAVSGSATVGAGNTVPRSDYFDPIVLNTKKALSLSDDGSLLAYVSQAGDIVPGQNGPAVTDNVFLYRRSTGQSSLVSGVNGSATATGNAASGFPVLSGDGSLLALHALASKLNSGLFDGNGVADVFTSATGATGVTLVSRAAFARPLPGNSFSTSVSADGRYTVFASTASNLVPNQVRVNDNQNVFLFDKQKESVTLVNHVPGLPSTTGDGGILGLLGRSRVSTAGFTPQPADAHTPSYLRPVISADGSFIAFVSFDDNLVPDDSLVGTFYLSLYLYNVQTGAFTLVSQPQTYGGDTAIDPAFSPVISADGRYLAYVTGFSASGNPVLGEGALLLYDRIQGTTTFITNFTSPPNSPHAGTTSSPAISDDGRFVTYVNQGNVYVFDRTSGSSALVSHSSSSLTMPADGTSNAPAISHDGSYAAFVSQATDLVNGQSSGSSTNVFLYNVVSQTVSLVSGVNGSASITGNGDSDSPAISGDGGYVAYRSDATNLVSGQSGSGGNIFEFNRLTGSQTLVSHSAASLTAAANGASSEPVIDDDGHLVSYASAAGNLIPNQSGPTGVKNVFLWLRQTDANILASGQNGSPTLTANADSDFPLLTRNSFPGFSSLATNLLPGIGGNSIAFINTLVQLVLAPNTIADGSPGGAMVGTVSVSSLLVGQFIPPTYTIPANELNNASFAIDSNTGALSTQFQANFAVTRSYQVNVHVDIGFGDDSGTLTVAVNPSVSDQDKAFVSQVYLDLLKRPVDAAGLAFWSDQLANGRPRAIISQALTHSDEYLATIIKPAYVKFLGRAVDAGGLAFWTGLMRAGLTDEQLEANFIASPEYYAHNGGTDKGWIDGTYVDLLGRQPDTSGENFWTMQAGVIGRGGVALGFAKSAESEMRHVEADYMTYLLRPSDPAGLAFWTNQFILGGQTNEDLITGFLASDEYYKRSTM
jgi:hypothetical protein